MVSTTKKNFLIEVVLWGCAFVIVCCSAFYHEELISFYQKKQRQVTLALVDYYQAGNNQPENTQPVEEENVYHYDRTVTLQADRRGHFDVRAEINGTSIALMVDTGATKIALTYEDADRLGITDNLSFTDTVATANGYAQVARTTLESVNIDEIEIRNVSAVVVEEGKLETSLLGMSFISRLKKVEMNGRKLVLIQ